jgi:hypothetical protein
MLGAVYPEDTTRNASLLCRASELGSHLCVVELFDNVLQDRGLAQPRSRRETVLRSPKQAKMVAKSGWNTLILLREIGNPEAL